MAAPNALNAAQRAEAMGERLLDAMRSGLIAPGAAELVHTAYLLATKPRAAQLPAKDPRLLHPGRTVLILWQDCNTRDVAELAAAALLESENFEFRAQLDEFPARAIVQVVEAIPNPQNSGDRLLEDLLALDPSSARIAVAERLDHLRHLHLGDRAFWHAGFELATEVYLPVAQRTDPALARRLARWCEMFEKHRLRR